MDISTITKLYSIFKNKKWTDKDGNDIVYGNFCQLLFNLNVQQRAAIRFKKNVIEN